MLSLIRKLFRRQEEMDPGLPLESLTTTIAYPDGSKGTAYRASSVKKVDSVLEGMLAELRAAYPHIAERISLTWGTPDCEAYLASLLFDERAMDKDHQYIARTGFNPQIMSVLMLLQDEHRLCFCFSDVESGRLV